MRKNLHSLLAQERKERAGEGVHNNNSIKLPRPTAQQAAQKTLSNREKFAAKWLRKECFAKENVKRFSCYLGRGRRGGDYQEYQTQIP